MRPQDFGEATTKLIRKQLAGMQLFGALRNRIALLLTSVVIIVCTSLGARAQELECQSPKEGRVKAKALATTSQVFVTVSIEPEWHIFAPGAKGGVPLSVKIDSGSDFELNGKIHAEQNKKGEVEGVSTIRIPIKRTGKGNKLEFVFDYQACDPLECDPPARVKFAGQVTRTSPQKILLVVDADDERAKRISKQITDAGMECKIWEYKNELSKETLDSFDVVVTDCPGFRNSKDGFAAVAKIPKSKTPIVAVGFLGTELIQNHDLALTSGYI